MVNPTASSRGASATRALGATRAVLHPDTPRSTNRAADRAATDASNLRRRVGDICKEQANLRENMKAPRFSNMLADAPRGRASLPVLCRA